MKYSQLLGVLACIALVAICFIPWSYVEEKNIVITGMNAAVKDYGKPGLFNIIISVPMCICFIVPKLWVKRANVIFAAINTAWAFRNFLLMSACHMGECPQKKAGSYLLMFLSFFLLIMTFLPPIKIMQEESN